MSNFYMISWPDDKRFGLARGPKFGAIKFPPDEGIVEAWTPMQFEIENGKFADYQGNDWALPICSPKMRQIIDEHVSSKDVFQWLEAFIKKGDETRTYYILYFPYRMDVLDLENSTMFGDVLIKPVLDRNKVSDRCIFPVRDRSTTVICEKLQKALWASNCTCLTFSKMLIC